MEIYQQVILWNWAIMASICLLPTIWFYILGNEEMFKTTSIALLMSIATCGLLINIGIICYILVWLHKILYLRFK